MIKRKSKHEFVVNATMTKPITVEDLDDMKKWCHATFGPSGRKRKYRWRFGWVDREKDCFYFRNEKDALFFVLRWQ